jgi:hypothetical protein
MKPGNSWRSDDDWLISLAYESLRFKANVPVAIFDRSVDDIERHVIPVLQAKGVTDLRAEARQYVLDLLIENRGLTDGNLAALMAATVGWLVKTSAAGEQLLAHHGQIRSIHYDITTFMVEGRRAINFRLVLGAGDTIPD